MMSASIHVPLTGKGKTRMQFRISVVELRTRSLCQYECITFTPICFE